MSRECTCLGSCRGASGLGLGWVCALRAELRANHDPGDEHRPPPHVFWLDAPGLWERVRSAHRTLGSEHTDKWSRPVGVVSITAGYSGYYEQPEPLYPANEDGA